MALLPLRGVADGGSTEGAGRSVLEVGEDMQIAVQSEKAADEMSRVSSSKAMNSTMKSGFSFSW